MSQRGTEWRPASSIRVCKLKCRCSRALSENGIDCACAKRSGSRPVISRGWHTDSFRGTDSSRPPGHLRRDNPALCPKRCGCMPGADYRTPSSSRCTRAVPPAVPASIRTQNKSTGSVGPQLTVVLSARPTATIAVTPVSSGRMKAKIPRARLIA